MKLKDIFPRWLFRERAYGELELGGGSAFAHLTEDAETSQLVADWMFRVSAPAGAPAFGAASATTEVLAYTNRVEVYGDATAPDASAYSVWDFQDANAPYLDIHRDGSLHWGDGTSAPVNHLKANGEGGGVYLTVGSTWGSLYVGSDLDTNGYVAMGTNTNGDGRPAIEFYDGGAGDLFLILDTDGDLAVPGKGKLAFQP